MDTGKIDTFILNNSKYLPSEKLGIIREKMQKLDNSRFFAISSVEMKDPTSMLLFSIFLGTFGVDRFMLGETGTGIAKLLLSWITFGIWWLIDICTITKKTKEYNLNLLLQVL